MSAGYVHKRASIILAIGFLVGGILSFNPKIFLCSLGALIGIMMTPDWDVDNGFDGDKWIREHLGIVFEKIWDAFLYPYRRSMKHGSPLSHFPIIGTTGRIVYCLFGLIIFPCAIAWLGGFDLYNTLSKLYWSGLNEYLVMVFIGLASSDIIHWGLDISTTEHKKK